MLSQMLAQPDVTLLLDMDGIIREATVSDSMHERSVEAWLGRPWIETVANTGDEKVRRMVEDARSTGVSAFRQVTQRFPSGRELPIEYTTVLVRGRTGLLAVGKSLQAVAELQSRLVAAQQAMERDYWKLRDIETRYRLLFQTSAEAVMLLRADDLRILDANPAAMAALGFPAKRPHQLTGYDFLINVLPAEQEILQTMLGLVREQGQAPGIVMHLGREKKGWLVRASLMTTEAGQVFFVQLASAGKAPQIAIDRDPIAVEDLIERLPDAFVVVNTDGIIRRANRAFVDLVAAGGKSLVVGERLGRWLSQPGADLAVLLATLRRQPVVRLFSTTIYGELGAVTEVNISAARSGDEESGHLAILIRDVVRHAPPNGDADQLIAALGPLAERVGKTSLRTLVGDTIGVVERHYIRAALVMAHGNRTAAASLLGLSRQSLYAKLNRYQLGQSDTATND